MSLLCFDVSSGGISAALLNSQLESIRTVEQEWNLTPGESGAATLSADNVIDGARRAIRDLHLTAGEPVDAVCIGTFMHNCVLLGDDDRPLTPLFTWLDRRGESGIEFVQSRLGMRFHEITGCRYHPMFPVFKIAAIGVADPEVVKKTRRAVSIKSMFLHKLTRKWVEDHGLASASGFFNIHEGNWDREILGILGLEFADLPQIASRTALAGSITAEASAEFGLRAGTPVVVGSGDGFLANLGSGCERPQRIAVTLGTSAVARQTVKTAVLDARSGTFCYMADADHTWLLGCAGSNGGNVLDWGRRLFGEVEEIQDDADLPVFLPLLHGERSPDWNSHLTGSWHGLTARHGAAELSRSVVEGVVFNLAHFVEIIGNTSGIKPTDVVLSGNGFRNRIAAPVLAGILDVPVWIPSSPGLASLRGAGVCALRALERPIPELGLNRISPLADAKIDARYREYRRLRSNVG